MAFGTPATVSSLQEHLKQHPNVRLVLPESEDFETVRQYPVALPPRPFAIARPQTAEDVQALVQFCIKNGVDFNVRGGGHDCAGRSQIDGVLSIDMRDIKHVHVNENKTTARVGGGILLVDLAEKLAEQELVTPSGTVASVGYTGWATLGGYGPFSTLYGMGVDQIVGAKLVDAKGELVEADSELLKGIRGGGGIFGVIIELVVKVFPLKELLCTNIAYESSDMQATWSSFTSGYHKLEEEGLPAALQLQIAGADIPGPGKLLTVGATWASPDHDEGRRWFDKIAGLATCIMNNPQPVSVAQYTRSVEAMLTYPSYGRLHTLNIRGWTAKTVEIMAKYNAIVPGGGMAISVHALREPKPCEESVFGPRVKHQMLEIIALTGDQSLVEQGEKWGYALIEEIKEKDPENVLEGGYISLLRDDNTDLKKVYGNHYDELVELKRKYDPENVFKYAIPKIAL